MSKHSSSGSEGGSRKGNKDKAEDDKLHMESASQADTSDDSIGEPSAKSSKSEVNSVPGTATKKGRKVFCHSSSILAIYVPLLFIV